MGLLAGRSFHYGWVVCAACALALFCTSGLAVNAFAVYQPFIMEAAGLTNAQSSMLVTARSLMGFASVFLIPLYYRVLSLRAGLALAVAMEGVGFVLFGLGRDFWLCCIAALLLGVGYGLGTMVPVAMLVSRWFTRRSVFALGICAASTGLSSVGIPSLIAAGVERLGLSAVFFAEAAVILLVACACFALLRDTPAQMGIEPYGGHLEGVAAGESAALVARRGASGLKGWPGVIAACALVSLGGVSTVGVSHLSVLAVGEGYSAAQASFALSVAGVALIFGKIAFGQIGDRVSVRAATLLFGGALFAGAAMLCAAGGNEALLVCGTSLYVMGTALSSVGLMAWAADLDGDGDCSSRRFQLLFAAGGLVFSALPGMLADAAGGCYLASYVLFAVLIAFVTISITALYRRAGL